jgi:Fe-S cluster assembly protein SufD
MFTRSETHAYLNGCGSKLSLNGIYISGNNQHHDLTTAIYHDVPDCTSKQIVRGVLGGKSTGVFQGKVRVAQDAQRTDGQQMSRAILISENANANAKPELEIYADDVICAHGATVGELDDDQLFYLNSRGVPMDKAREILIKAFLEDMINQSVDNSLHDFVFKEAELALSSIIIKETL